MKKITILLVLLFNVFVLKAQTGVNIKTPAGSSILEVNSTSKGVLFPRLDIGNLNNKAPVTATPMADGLWAYNSGASNINSQTLHYWDIAANSGNGAWIRHLYFKETPKVATIGLNRNLAFLNNKVANDEEAIGQKTTNAYQIVNSGYMPGLSIRLGALSRYIIAVGPGVYTLEASYLLNAPPPDPGNGTVIQNGYYNMGYLSDIWIRPYDPNTNIYGTNYFGGRVEGAVISKVDVDHRMRFLHTFAVTGSNGFEIDLFLGRRDGATFYDLVNIIASGTIIKLTKLN
ncbi:hypothetical protein OQX61_22350 [Pedobacter sp. PLR]|uniref:hypothetical protein n=1 Tax=Pedobacter sp. PLR TaxID=2994465 RepID=UPI0022471925|nr:hypothetical protein [Pedobacter sp. PLR]MCX2454027.1 hypothetical protein [Pedobacter sp. PLR]